MLLKKVLNKKKKLKVSNITKVILYYLIILSQTKFTLQKIFNYNFQNINYFFYYILDTLNFKLKNNINHEQKFNLFYPQLSKYKYIKKTSFFIENSKILTQNIITIKILYSNIVINISNIKNIPIVTFSSGISIIKKSKKIKDSAIKNLMKKINNSANKLNIKSLVVHFKGIKMYRKKIINMLGKKKLIKTIKIFNYFPHNGCKPKKN